MAVWMSTYRAPTLTDDAPPRSMPRPPKPSCVAVSLGTSAFQRVRQAPAGCQSALSTKPRKPNQHRPNRTVFEPRNGQSDRAALCGVVAEPTREPAREHEWIEPPFGRDQSRCFLGRIHREGRDRSQSGSDSLRVSSRIIVVPEPLLVGIVGTVANAFEVGLRANSTE
jgi:hypothetical protein